MSAVHRRARWRVLLAVGVGLVVVVAGGLLLFNAIRESKSTPEFASLADSPDPSLRGTVAYLDWKQDACLRVVAARGGTARVVTCLKGVNAGAGAELAWLDGGRVEVTQYGDWQKIIDVRSGNIVDVLAAQVPDVAPQRRPANETEDGRRVTSSNDNGRARITLEEPDGTRRALLDVESGGTYNLGTPHWSPDESFVLTTDEAARLLVTTLGDNPATRVLATELGGNFVATSDEV